MEADAGNQGIDTGDGYSGGGDEVMKNLIFLSFMLITWGSFAQSQIVDSTDFIKPGAEEVILDTSITNHLDAFRDKDDAIIYIFRTSSMVGAAVKWEIVVNDNPAYMLGLKDYMVAHINTAKKIQHVSYPNMKFNYYNFKPNRYYFVMMKGFKLKTGYLDPEAYDYIKTFERAKLGM